MCLIKIYLVKNDDQNSDSKVNWQKCHKFLDLNYKNLEKLRRQFLNN